MSPIRWASIAERLTDWIYAVTVPHIGPLLQSDLQTGREEFVVHLLAEFSGDPVRKGTLTGEVRQMKTEPREETWPARKRFVARRADLW